MKAIRNKNHISLTVIFKVITWQGLKDSRDIIPQIIPQSLKPNFTIQGASTSPILGESLGITELISGKAT